LKESDFRGKAFGVVSRVRSSAARASDLAWVTTKRIKKAALLVEHARLMKRKRRS